MRLGYDSLRQHSSIFYDAFRNNYKIKRKRVDARVRETVNSWPYVPFDPKAKHLYEWTRNWRVDSRVVSIGDLRTAENEPSMPAKVTRANVSKSRFPRMVNRGSWNTRRQSSSFNNNCEARWNDRLISHALCLGEFILGCTRTCFVTFLEFKEANCKIYEF